MSQAVRTNPASSPPIQPQSQQKLIRGCLEIAATSTLQVGKANGISPSELSSLWMGRTFLPSGRQSIGTVLSSAAGTPALSPDGNTCWDTEQMRFKTKVEPSRARGGDQCDNITLPLQPLPIPPTPLGNEGKGLSGTKAPLTRTLPSFWCVGVGAKGLKAS